jgi:hypothetical protein
MTEKLKVPKFASEAEEAQWWFDHRDEVAKAFEVAAANGTLRRGSAASLALKENVGVGLEPATSIHLDPDDVSRARALAAQRGLRYQTYLKMLVHEALLAEEGKLTR